MAVDWAAVRAEFPALEHWTFLNTATFGQLARRTTAAVAEHFARRDERACHDFLAWYDDADAVRAGLARLVNAQPHDIAFIPLAAQALGLLLGGIDWEPGDRLVTLRGEFPNNVYYPSLLGRRGAEFVEVDWDRFYEAVNERTRLVVLSTVNYTNGFRPPIEEIAAFLRERGVLLYLDGTQSLGALRFDCAAVRPAMLAVHGYKWMLAPTGAGFLYVDPAMRQWLEPNVVGWRSHRDWRRVDSLHHGAPDFVDTAEKYEGGSLVFPCVYALGAAVRMLLEVGPEAIERRVLELAEGVRRIVGELGGELVAGDSPHFRSPIVAARFPGHDASALRAALERRRVLVSARHGNLRVSVHFYNNEQDLETFRRELAALLAL
jgi:selenocysteine lyase/cysteine desulfurase